MEEKKQNANENIKFYQLLREVPQEAKKNFNNGSFSGTDINPMWRIKRLTEIFGPAGFGWYYEVVNRHLEHASDNVTICAFVSVNLFVNINGQWSKPIYGEGGNTMCSWIDKKQKISTTDEAFKMALTDAISNATKQLGLGADVWFERDKTHSTKYDLQQERAKENASEADLDAAIKEAYSSPDMKALQEVFNKHVAFQANAKFKAAVIEQGNKFKDLAKAQSQPNTTINNEQANS